MSHVIGASGAAYSILALVAHPTLFFLLPSSFFLLPSVAELPS